MGSLCAKSVRSNEVVAAKLQREGKPQPGCGNGLICVKMALVDDDLIWFIWFYIWLNDCN